LQVDRAAGRATRLAHPANEPGALSGNSIHLVVAGAGHESLLDTRADAAISAQTIVQVVAAARTGTSLTAS